MTRKNVIELLGGDANKYDSCILSTYALDFGFFEHRLLPALHKLNIGNIHLLVDEQQLEDAYEYATESNRTVSAGYSIQPIRVNQGVFHPKILLLLGERNGLLLVGSGNLTGPGMNSNEEIWSAFHVNVSKTIPLHAPILLDALQWLEQWKPREDVTLIKKWKWLREYSPWLEVLEDLRSNNGYPLPDGRSIAFLSQNSTSSTFNQWVDVIGKKSVKRITCISPYFDSDGYALKALYSEFSPEQFNVFLDKTTIPFEFFDEPNFYDWQEGWGDNDVSVGARLHAKMYHWELNDRTEAIYLGSSNATRAGFGISPTRGINIESGIWMTRQLGPLSWLDELGVSIPKNMLEGWDVANKDRVPSPAYNSRFRRKIHIQYAEIFDDTVNLILGDKTDEINQLYNAVISSVAGTVLLRGSLAWLDERTIQVDLHGINIGGGVIALELNNNRVSNAVPIHFKVDIDRANPDPIQKRLENKLRELSSSKWDMGQIFQYEDGIKEDAFYEYEESNKRSGAIKLNTYESAETTVYKVLSPEEFNKSSFIVSEKERELMQSSSSRLADFLNAYMGDSIQSLSASIDSEEQRLVSEDDEQVSEFEEGIGEALGSIHENMRFSKSDVDAVNRYSINFGKRYENQLSEFYDLPITNGPLKDSSMCFLNPYRELSMMAVVSTSHVLLLTDKVTSLHYSERICNARDFLNNSIGPFMLLARQGFIRGEVSEYFVRKVKDRVDDVFLNLIFLWCSCKWSLSKRKESLRLIMNIRFLHNQLNQTQQVWGASELVDKLNERLNLALIGEDKMMPLDWRENISLLEETGNRFDIWWEGYQKRDSEFINSKELYMGAWIVHKNLGISLVKSITRKGAKNPRVHLSHSGMKQELIYDLATKCIECNQLKY